MNHPIRSKGVDDMLANQRDNYIVTFETRHGSGIIALMVFDLTVAAAIQEMFVGDGDDDAYARHLLKLDWYPMAEGETVMGAMEALNAKLLKVPLMSAGPDWPQWLNYVDKVTSLVISEEEYATPEIVNWELYPVGAEGKSENCAATFKADPENILCLKPADSYFHGEDNPIYRQHVLWNALFGEKYGMAPPLPYDAVKVRVPLHTEARVEDWLLLMEDEQLSSRIHSYLNAAKLRGNAYNFHTLAIPLVIFEAIGIPKEMRFESAPVPGNQA